MTAILLFGVLVILATSIQSSPSKSLPKITTEVDFKKTIKDNKNVFIFFTKDDCRLCGTIRSTLIEQQQNISWPIFEVNSDYNSWQTEFDEIPRLGYYKEGIKSGANMWMGPWGEVDLKSTTEEFISDAVNGVPKTLPPFIYKPNAPMGPADSEKDKENQQN